MRRNRFFIRNSFLLFSLSSINNNVPHQQNAYLSMHLIAIETIIVSAIESALTESPPVEYLNKGYPHSTAKKDKPLRKPRQRLRPRRKNEPKPRAERLDRVPTRTRLARRDASTTGKSPTRMTLGRVVRPASPTNSQTKVKAFNAIANHFLPPWLQRRQHESSTSVKSHFLLPIPGWAVKTCHCSHHVVHCSATDPPRGGSRRVSYPEIPGARPYPIPVDPASTHRRSTKKQGLHATGSGVFSPSQPLRHRGVRGWPAILGARRYSDFHSTRQNFTSNASPGVSASS
jgi:hypothetical protein